ncbi:MAG TPA: hypothetical protein VH414_00105 [Lichenihabitans sp.]|jgi:hypothetical protein|nr:hypothetical protein [Lichenihabitans sp.]
MPELDRSRLAQFADVLISGSPGWPSASQADVHGKWMDITLSARPDLIDLVVDVIGMEGDPHDVLQQIKTREIVRFDRFSTAIAGTYLMNPRIRKQLGLPAGMPEANPPFPDEADYYLEDGLLEPVIARGSAMFKRTPGRS